MEDANFTPTFFRIFNLITDSNACKRILWTFVHLIADIFTVVATAENVASGVGNSTPLDIRRKWGRDKTESCYQSERKTCYFFHHEIIPS